MPVAKGRDSGMPPVEQWETFFKPTGILEALGCSGVAGDVVEFGSGYGTFTIAAAPRVSGIIYALDVDPAMVSATAARASAARARNIVVVERDFVADGSGRPDGSACFVMLFNILHIEDPVSLLREAHRNLRVGGIAGVIHWRCDVATPRGPPFEIRPRPEECRAWAEEAGLHWLSYPPLTDSPWHWGLKLERRV
jgi:SAM-dependent methyltransferase